jgi:hypothetical protein
VRLELFLNLFSSDCKGRTFAGRNNKALEQVVMRLSIEDDVSNLSWTILETADEARAEVAEMIYIVRGYLA